jgi:uncharacterized damage-inducible protein DinB
MTIPQRAQYTSDVLHDIHERSHENLRQLMEHCRAFNEAELNREMEGFGYPSIPLQFHHEIAGEKYWLGVIHGRMDVDENESEYRTIASLEVYREEVFGATEAYLRGASIHELNTARPMITWQGHEKVLVPAQIVLRTQVHYYHHQGQILAMCRLLGKPGEGMNYRIT